MSVYLKFIILLVFSNVFMTFAWYAHLKNLNNKTLWLAIIVSWGIAFFEYVFQVPANRLGFFQANITLEQLKIIQEVLTLLIFIPFAIFYMKQPISINFFYAGLCLMGAVFFIFKPS